MISQDHVDEMADPRKVRARQMIEDAEIAAKWEAEYRRAGPAHLSAETCAAIERDIARRSTPKATGESGKDT